MKPPAPKPQRKLIELPCIIYRLVAQWESRRLISVRSEFNSRQGNQSGDLYFSLDKLFFIWYTVSYDGMERNREKADTIAGRILHELSSLRGVEY